MVKKNNHSFKMLVEFEIMVFLQILQTHIVMPESPLFAFKLL